MKNILIVDDDELTLSLYDLLLEDMENIDWHTSESGGSALTYLDKCTPEKWPEIVFIDLHMPDMSGYEFIEKYEERFGKKNPKICFYVLSSSISQKDQEKINQYPLINGFLSKPLTEEVLLKLIDRQATAKIC